MCGSSCRLLVLSPPGPGRPAHPTSTHLASVAHGPAPAFILPRHRGLLPGPAPPRGCRVCLGRFPTFPGLIPSALCQGEPQAQHRTPPRAEPATAAESLAAPSPQEGAPVCIPRSLFTHMVTPAGRNTRTPAWSPRTIETHLPRFLPTLPMLLESSPVGPCYVCSPGRKIGFL